MWTTRCRPQVDGGGRTQTSRVNTTQIMTAICLFDTALRKAEGRNLFVGQRDETLGDIQKVDDEERELVDDEDDEFEGKENFEMEDREAGGRRLGDLSMNGSLGGELKSRHTVDSRKPILGCEQAAVQKEEVGYFSECL